MTPDLGYERKQYEYIYNILIVDQVRDGGEEEGSIPANVASRPFMKH